MTPIPKPIFPLIYSLLNHDCHPEIPRGKDYHQTTYGFGSVSYEEAVFLYGMVLVTKPNIVCETGTETGLSTIHLAQALSDQQYGKLYAIEIDKGNYNRTLQAIQENGLNQWVELLNDDSRRHLEQIPINRDYQYLCFLDSLQQTRIDEFRIIERRFPKGTVVIIHDTSPLHPMGQMNLDTVIPVRWLHLPTPRGISVTIL